MAGTTLIASSRGVFSAGAKTLTLTVPALARKGDTLVAFVAHNAADARGTAPAGWALMATLAAGADTLDVYARMISDAEPASVGFSFVTAANECMGELVALRGTAPGIVVEASATTTFTAASSLATAGVPSQQAINLILVVWTCSGSPGLTLPAGFTAVDNFSTAVVSSRSMLVGYKLAGATGALTFASSNAGASTTGRSFTFAVRDRIPVQPAPLLDVVPGNIGLIGKDTRPAR
jgi:hypothetical protein